jgi:phosphatidylserine/phosphatidylglycerophosphate/cardiolipin synthase-like enzyme
MTPDHMGRLCALFLPTAPIAKALLDAHKRGVQVQVILDKSQRTEKYSSADFRSCTCSLRIHETDLSGAVDVG